MHTIGKFIQSAPISAGLRPTSTIKELVIFFNSFPDSRLNGSYSNSIRDYIELNYTNFSVWKYTKL